MNPALKGGVILAVAVGLVTIVWTAAGLHEKPMLGLVVLGIFILLTAGLLVWTLKQTAPESPYGKQLLNSLIFGVVAGVLIFVISWVNAAVLFPNAIEEQGAAALEFMQGMNMPEDALQAQIDKLDQVTPVSQAFQGTIGTVVTSLIIGAIAAIFVRKK